MKHTTTKPITLQEFIKRRIATKLQELKSLEEQYDLESVISGYEDEGVSDGDPVRGRMSWGEVPMPKDLQAALDAEGGWSMTLRGSDERAFEEAVNAAGMDYGEAESMMSNGRGMHKVLTALRDYALEHDDMDNAGSLASSILDVLGFEWI